MKGKRNLNNIYRELDVKLYLRCHFLFIKYYCDGNIHKSVTSLTPVGIEIEKHFREFYNNLRILKNL